MTRYVLKKFDIDYSSGQENFVRDGKAEDFNLHDFWSWAYSDCINNTTRGVLAEFLVAKSLKIKLVKPRDAWAKYDLTYNGYGVEVKSASYHQRWSQEKISAISYNIAPTRAWDENTNIQEKGSKRQSSFYIFCILDEKTRKLVNPFNIDQWRFWVVPTNFLNKRKRSQKSITYNSLIKEIGKSISFKEIKPSVDKLIKYL